MESAGPADSARAFRILLTSREVRHDLIGDVAESRSHTTMAISFDMLKTGRFSTASKLLVRAFLFSSLALQCSATPLRTVASNVLSFAYEHTNQAIWGKMPSIEDIRGNMFFLCSFYSDAH